MPAEIVDVCVPEIIQALCNNIIIGMPYYVIVHNYTALYLLGFDGYFEINFFHFYRLYLASPQKLVLCVEISYSQFLFRFLLSLYLMLTLDKEISHA